MKKRKWLTVLMILALSGLGSSDAVAGESNIKVFSETAKGFVEIPQIKKSDDVWKQELTAEQYKIARQKGTEPAYSGAFWNHHGNGIYQCVACGTDLFSSTSKYNSGTGWPSFWQPIAVDNIILVPDPSAGEQRTEVLCRCCQSHLGHVFNDGPKPTGKRYCINSAVLKFIAK